LRGIFKIDKEFAGLFSGGIDETADPSVIAGGGYREQFMRRYGWHYTTEQIAAYMRITLSEAWDLPTVEYLNAAAYLKAKGEFEKASRK